ncbi:MAG: tRNA lysidine(34) synthetase TilS, partial [Deltaproteobacteria bacterium]|nr:tRNA lysidine(34) synthetase TilS [Deltaproteobacteria bacterium]
VAVAVSGGADSVALLDLLVSTAGWHGAALSVVTVDHGTREDSARDADFVVALAEGYGLACHRERVSAASRSEAALRAARHAVFAALDVERVATAHHRRDQVETVLLRLIRGTATTGLAGMRWQSGRLVRPLLDTEPDRLRAHLRERGGTWREDPSNAEPGADRNRIRHEVLPVLRSIRPGAEAAVARTAARLSEESEWLERVASDQDPGDLWPSAWLAGAHPALVRTLIRRRDPDLDTNGVEAALSSIRSGRPARVGRWEGKPGPEGVGWVRIG